MNGRNITERFQTIQRWSNLTMLPVSIVMLLLSMIIHTGWMFIVGSFLFLLWLAITCLWVVPTGNVGFMRVMGKLSPRSYGDGPQFRIPLISETFLMSVMVITKIITDVKKVITRNNLTITVTVTYQLEERYAYIVFKMMGPEYYESHLSKWIDACLDTMVSKLSYPHFQAMKGQVEEWASKLVVYELALKSSDITEELVAEIARQEGIADPDDVIFDVTACDLMPARELIPNPHKDPTDPAHSLLPDFVDGDLIFDEVVVGDGDVERVQRMKLDEREDYLPGVNLFKNVSVKINEVKFEETYEEARANVAVRRAEVIETRLKAEKAVEAAKGIRDADIIKAEGEAKKAEIIGEGEARKITATMNAEGKALKDNDELLRREGLRHIPLVFGGNSNNMLIDSKLILDEMEERMGRRKIITPDDK